MGRDKIRIGVHGQSCDHEVVVSDKIRKPIRKNDFILCNKQGSTSRNTPGSWIFLFLFLCFPTSSLRGFIVLDGQHGAVCLCVSSSEAFLSKCDPWTAEK